MRQRGTEHWGIGALGRQRERERERERERDEVRDHWIKGSALQPQQLPLEEVTIAAT